MSVGEMNSVAVPSRSPTTDFLDRTTELVESDEMAQHGSHLRGRLEGHDRDVEDCREDEARTARRWRRHRMRRLAGGPRPAQSSSASVSGSYPASPPWWSIFATYSREGASMTSDAGRRPDAFGSCAGRGRWSSNRRGGVADACARRLRLGRNRARDYPPTNRDRDDCPVADPRSGPHPVEKRVRHGLSPWQARCTDQARSRGRCVE